MGGGTRATDRVHLRRGYALILKEGPGEESKKWNERLRATGKPCAHELDQHSDLEVDGPSVS